MSLMVGKANLPEITENYESVERLVMETPRGRWFLEEFARRHRARELTLVLDSILRLEKAIVLKESSARTDDLAERINKAIDTPAAPQIAAEALDARQLRYFKSDEDVFHPAPPAAPRAVEAETKPSTRKLTAQSAETSPERKGARLIIRRKEDPAAEELSAPSSSSIETGPVAHADAQPQKTEPVIQADALTHESQPAPHADAQPQDVPKRRIVIIRHKAGEELAVPLQNEVAVAS